MTESWFHHASPLEAVEGRVLPDSFKTKPCLLHVFPSFHPPPRRRKQMKKQHGKSDHQVAKTTHKLPVTTPSQVGPFQVDNPVGDALVSRNPKGKQHEGSKLRSTHPRTNQVPDSKRITVQDLPNVLFRGNQVNPFSRGCLHISRPGRLFS